MNSHVFSFERFENLDFIEIIYSIHNPLRNWSTGLTMLSLKRFLSEIVINFSSAWKKKSVIKIVHILATIFFSGFKRFSFRDEIS